MIRPFRAETLRYGHYSVAGEFVYDHPFQWGSKRTGPDLHRVGGKYSDEWHRIHLNNPRDVVPESNMPAYPWLEKNTVDAAGMAAAHEGAAHGRRALHRRRDRPGRRRRQGQDRDGRAGRLPAGLGLASSKTKEHCKHGHHHPAHRRHAGLASPPSWASPGGPIARRNRDRFDEAARIPFEQD